MKPVHGGVAACVAQKIRYIVTGAADCKGVKRVPSTIAIADLSPESTEAMVAEEKQYLVGQLPGIVGVNSSPKNNESTKGCMYGSAW